MQLEKIDKFSANFTALRLIIEHYDILKLNIGAEIGVLMGNTSSYLLKHFPELTLLCIDPYKAYNEIEGERDQKCMDFYENVAVQQLSHFGKRAQMMKSTSLEVANGMRDDVLDFVFIDAGHDYASVKEDLLAWHPKVRPGGLVSGHDYRWEGVKKAVDEFVLKFPQNIGGYTGADSDIWFYIKEG